MFIILKNYQFVIIYLILENKKGAEYKLANVIPLADT